MPKLYNLNMPDEELRQLEHGEQYLIEAHRLYRALEKAGKRDGLTSNEVLALFEAEFPIHMRIVRAKRIMNEHPEYRPDDVLGLLHLTGGNECSAV